MKSVKYLLAFAILLALFAVFNSQEEMSSFIEKKGRYSSQTSMKKVYDIVFKENEEEDDEDEDEKEDEDDEDEKDEKPKKKLFTFPKLNFNSTNLREKILKKPLVKTLKHMAKNFTKLFTFRKNKKN